MPPCGMYTHDFMFSIPGLDPENIATLSAYLIHLAGFYFHRHVPPSLAALLSSF